jgi:hypothetical protein
VLLLFFEVFLSRGRGKGESVFEAGEKNSVFPTCLFEACLSARRGKKNRHAHSLSRSPFQMTKTTTPTPPSLQQGAPRPLTSSGPTSATSPPTCSSPAPTHSGWRCGEYAYSPGDWELFGIDYMFDADFKPWVLEVRRYLFVNFSSSLSPKFWSFLV